MDKLKVILLLFCICMLQCLVSALKLIDKKGISEDAKSNETRKILVGTKAPSTKQITYKRLTPSVAYYTELTTSAPSTFAPESPETTKASGCASQSQKKKKCSDSRKRKRPPIETTPMTPPFLKNTRPATTKAPSVKKDLRKRVAPSTTLVPSTTPPVGTDMCSTIGGEVCKEKCRNEVDGISCYCRSGFQLKDDLVSCEEIDECKTLNGGCTHLCKNTHGSFKCACGEGFTLAKDQRTCLDVNECEASTGAPKCPDGQKCVNFHGSYACMHHEKVPKRVRMMRRTVFLVLFAWSAFVSLLLSICVVLRCIEIGNLDWCDPRKSWAILFCQQPEGGGPTLCMMCMYKNPLKDETSSTPKEKLSAGKKCGRCCARLCFGKDYNKDDSPWQRVRKRFSSSKQNRAVRYRGIPRPPTPPPLPRGQHSYYPEARRGYAAYGEISSPGDIVSYPGYDDSPSVRL